jgi:hypothetical protein
MADQDRSFPSHLTLRLTPEQWMILKSEARGMSYSEYVRSRTFGEITRPRFSHSHVPIIDPKLLSQMLGLLGKLPHTRELDGLRDAALAGTLILSEEKFQVITTGCADIRTVKHIALKLLNYRKIHE